MTNSNTLPITGSVPENVMKNLNSMADYLRHTAQVCPSSVAIKNNNTSITFSQLDRYCDRLASFFCERGLVRGDRVVCCSSNAWQSVVCFWAVLKAGGVISPVANDMPRKNLQYILRDSEAKFLVMDEVNAGSNEGPEDLLAIDSLSYIISTTVQADSKTQAVLSFYRAIEGEAIAPNRENLDIDLAAIIYTSGSTGEPKGVMLTHRNMITATESLNTYLGYQPTDIVLSVLPLSFDYGLYQMIMSVSVGATLILERDFTWPLLTLKKIDTEKVTVLPIVPTIVLLLDECAKRAKFNLSSVRLMSNTGAEVNQYHLDIIAKRFPNAAMYSMYGLTECKRCSYLSPEDLLRKPGSVGVAIPNTEISIVDEQGNRLGANQVGEIVVRGGTVMKGYWKKPEQTAKKLKDGAINGEKVLHTGDYGLMDEEGYLYFKGRMDEVLKCRGMKVSPKEVEAFLMSIEGTKEAAIIGETHERHGVLLRAFITHENPGPQSEQLISDICQQGLAPSQRPEQVTILNKMPKTTNGKIDKKSLKASLNKPNTSLRMNHEYIHSIDSAKQSSQVAPK